MNIKLMYISLGTLFEHQAETEPPAISPKITFTYSLNNRTYIICNSKGLEEMTRMSDNAQ